MVDHFLILLKVHRTLAKKTVKKTSFWKMLAIFPIRPALNAKRRIFSTCLATHHLYRSAWVFKLEFALRVLKMRVG